MKTLRQISMRKIGRLALFLILAVTSLTHGAEDVAFRPEYLEAVAASRWNLWLIPLFLSAPFFLLLPVLRRWHWAAITGLALVGAVATWFSVFAYSETIWKTMEAHAQTAAEMEDVASDTGRVFGPFFIGIPFALFYSAVWVGISLVIRAIAKKSPAKPAF